jgi:hypothetical protein
MGVNKSKREADIRLFLLSRLIMSGATPPLPYMPSWGEQGQIFLLIYQTCNIHKYKQSPTKKTVFEYASI